MSADSSRKGLPTPQKPGRPAYEELLPRFEWEDNASSHVLNVFLPGFIKEQLKLTSDKTTRSLNVRGERGIGTGRFVRFNKDFRIPDKARFNEMQARFQAETLIVTIPKQTVISPPPLPPLPTQASKPQEMGYAFGIRRPTSQKEEDMLNNKAQERDGPVKLPSTGKKVDDRVEKERPSTLIPPTSLTPFPNPAPKPVPTPAPRTQVLKVSNVRKDKPEEQDDSVKLWPLKEMKVGMVEKKKQMVNVVMAAIVLVAIGAYIYYYTLAMRGRN